MNRRNPLTLPELAVERLHAEITRFGMHGLETGGFLLASEQTPDQPTVLALAARKGITRRFDQFMIAGEALEALFAWAEQHHFRVRAQVHSHGHQAFLSRTDRTYGLNVPGFISAVVPTFATPPRTPAAWGWWSYSKDDWQTIQPPALGGQFHTAVTFDTGGVHSA